MSTESGGSPQGTSSGDNNWSPLRRKLFGSLLIVMGLLTVSDAIGRHSGMALAASLLFFLGGGLAWTSWWGMALPFWSLGMGLSSLDRGLTEYRHRTFHLASGWVLLLMGVAFLTVVAHSYWRESRRNRARVEGRDEPGIR